MATISSSVLARSRRNNVYKPVVYQPNSVYNKDSEVISSLSSGLNKCGKILGVVCAIICIVIIVVLFIVGSSYKNKTNKIKNTTISIVGTIVKVDNNYCNISYVTRTIGRRRNRRTETVPVYNCNLTISYMVNNNVYTTNLHTTDRNYTVGNQINIFVDKSDSTKVYYRNQVQKEAKSASTMFTIGGVLIFLLISHLFLLRYSDIYKKIVCLDMVLRIFNY